MKLDNFYVIGVSHKTLKLEEREGFLERNSLENIAKRNYSDERIKGYVHLSTCLREELYLHLNASIDILEIVQELQNSNYIYIYKGMDALEHLFKVVCGLDSVIKGEDQILSQIKRSYSNAQIEKTTTNVMNLFFHKAIELGKKFRNKSKIAENPLSLEAISVKFIRKKIGNLKGKRVFVLGIGELSQGILNILRKSELENLAVSNRSKKKVEVLRDRYSIDEIIDYNRRYEGIEKNDIIISITSAPHPIITREELEDRGLLGDRKRLYLDLAVPRDIEESIDDTVDSDVYNIDAVWKVYKNNLKNRERAEEDYQYLIEKQIEIVKKWFRYREELEKVC